MSKPRQIVRRCTFHLYIVLRPQEVWWFYLWPAHAMHVAAFYYGELMIQNAKDYHWGVLGVTSITLEVRNAFDKPCASFLSDVLPRNLPALPYTAKLLRSPLDAAKVPDVTEIDLSPHSRRVS